MKKILLSLFLLVFLTGCVGLPVIYDCDCEKEKTEEVETPVIPEGNAKTGLSFLTNVSLKENNTLEYDITFVAVTVNDEGVITSCSIDGVNTKIVVDATGAITTDLTKAVKTKQELGDAYNMVAWGGAKYEWYEQANSLAQYVVGKTASQVEGIAVNESTKPTGSDLSSSVTIAIGGYKEAIVKAVNNATHLGASTSDELHLAANVSVSSSKNATADAKGLAEVDVDVIALTESKGYITSSVLDAVQAKVEFDATGTITTDLTKEILTKNELGDAYNMVAWGGAKYEWYEQAASFCEYIKGKTASQVEGIAVNESTKPTATDLSATVTIAIGGFKALVAEALEGVIVGAENLKTGLSFLTNVSLKENNTLEYDITFVAVTVNSKGVITSCKIDGVNTKIAIDATGTITTDLTKAVKTKQELGDAYNMVAWGGAKYEWYEQANSLAQYVVGKTASQVEGIAVNESTKPTGSDLSSSVTIAIGGYKEAIVKAVNNATKLGATSADELHLAANVSVSSSKNATADAKGLAEVDVDVIALTENDGVITSSVLDAVQAKVEFDATGTITTDLTKEILTKNELGDAYNMVAWGGAKYEWYEQAASFCEYIKGKTASQVEGIAVNESTKPTGSDLSATVTIAIGGFKALVAEALE